MKKSRIVLVLCMMVVIAVASVAGTIAWLTDTTTPVTNTFTTAGIDISLAETSENEFQMIPGKEYAKDPKVTVEDATDVDIYLYVKIEEGECQTYLNYALNLEGWTALTEGGNVYWREVGANDTEKSWYLLQGNKVTVDPDLQKADNDNDTLSMPGEDLELKFTAYAIQKEGFTPASGWDKIGN